MEPINTKICKTPKDFLPPLSKFLMLDLKVIPFLRDIIKNISKTVDSGIKVSTPLITLKINIMVDRISPKITSIYIPPLILNHYIY